jgi:exosortase
VRLAADVTVAVEPLASPTRSRGVLLRGGIALAAILALYAPVFPALVWEWATYPNLSHGFAIPAIAAYLIWTRRPRLARLPATPAWAGLAVMASALVLFALGSIGAEPFLARISLPVTLLGATYLLAGRRIARELLPGIAYLFFMIPLPYLTLKGFTDQVRLFDASVTAAVLPWLGVPVYRDGVLLHLSNVTLEVADVCSSIPAIASLLALGAAYGLVRQRSRPVKLILLALSAPLGLGSNLVRIIVTAAGAYYLGPIALNNVVHMWNGATVFVVTFGVLVLVDGWLQRLPGLR